MANKAPVKSDAARRKVRPRLVVVREFSGQRSMREVFEQAIEKQAGEQFARWKASKTS